MQTPLAVVQDADDTLDDDELVQIPPTLPELISGLQALTTGPAKHPASSPNGHHQKHDVNAQLVAVHRASMSPFSQLPFDLVHAIFLHCLPADHNPYICAAEPPMLLTHVCRQWREVAFAMPMLWANIHVHIPFYPEPPFRHGQPTEHHDHPGTPNHPQQDERLAHLEDVRYWETKMRDLKHMVIQWLARAERCPISLSLSQFTSVFDQAKGAKEINAVVSVLLSRCAQWKSVELYASSPIIAQFLAVPTHHAPHLQRISIKWQTPMERNLNRGTNKLALVSPEGLMTVPELKSLSLQILPRNIMSLPVRWEGLTELIFDEHFGGLDSESSRRRFLPSDALDLLTLCPSLIRCRLAIGRGRMIPESPVVPTLSSGLLSNGNNLTFGSAASRALVRKPIRLASLEHLAIDEGIPLGDFLLCLDLPSLKEVVFSTALTPCQPEPQRFGASTANPIPVVPAGVFGQLAHIQPVQASTRPPSMPSPLIDLLSQCGRTLKKLTFDEAGLSLQDIEQALELVPNLTHLSMNRKSMMRSSTAGLVFGPNIPGAAPGYLSKRLLERMIPMTGSDTNLLSEDAVVNSLILPCLCPHLVSFSCRLSAPVSMQGTLIEFLRSRREQNPHVTLLQKCTVNFSSPSFGIASDEEDLGDLKDVHSELGMLDVDMQGFDLNVIYPSNSVTVPSSPIAGSSRAPGSSTGGGGSGKGGMASMMSHFVPRCRDMSAAMYGYGSWYATGGGGELRDAWFEAW